MSNNLGGTRAATGMSLDAAIAALNDALGEHDAAKTQPAALTIDNTNARTLTAAEMIGNVGFTFTAAGATAACTVTVPDTNADATTMRRGFFAVINDTGFDLTVTKSGQSETAPTLSDGHRSIFYYDGANVYVAVPQGSVGGDGADGTDPGLLYTYDVTTTDADPGAGKVRANNVDLSAATELYIDDEDRSGNNHEATLLTWDDSTGTVKGHVVVSRASDGAQAVFSVSGVTDASGYVKVTVAYVSGATSLTDADAVSLQFYRAGDAGSGTKATDAQVRSSTAGDLYIAPEVVESASAFVTLTDGANIALDWDTGINFDVTLAGNRTLDNPTNGQPGTWRTIVVTQDGTGSQTLTLDTQYKTPGGTLTLTTDANAVDVLSIFCVTSSLFYVFAGLDLS